MNTVLLKAILVIYSFIVSNSNIPQDIKDTALKVVSENISTIPNTQIIENPIINSLTPVAPTTESVKIKAAEQPVTPVIVNPDLLKGISHSA